MTATGLHGSRVVYPTVWRRSDVHLGTSRAELKKREASASMVLHGLWGAHISWHRGHAPPVLCTLFGLRAAPGLRTSEAMRLRVNDITTQRPHRHGERHAVGQRAGGSPEVILDGSAALSWVRAASALPRTRPMRLGTGAHFPPPWSTARARHIAADPGPSSCSGPGAGTGAGLRHRSRRPRHRCRIRSRRPALNPRCPLLESSQPPPCRPRPQLGSAQRAPP